MELKEPKTIVFKPNLKALMIKLITLNDSVVRPIPLFFNFFGIPNIFKGFIQDFSLDCC